MNQTKIGVIDNALIAKADINPRTKRKSGLDGLIIEFRTEELIQDGNIIEIEFEGKMKTFRIDEIELGKNNTFFGRATEYGYWAEKLIKHPKLDIRKLMRLPIYLIEDENRLKILSDEACWC